MNIGDRFPDNYLTCRAYGHRWSNTSVTRVLNARGKPIEYRAGLACDRCTTTRTQVLDAWGNLVRNAYSYAEGYAKDPGEERLTKQGARVGWISRTAVADEVEVEK